MFSSTISQILASSSHRLAALHDTARLDAEVLIAHVLNFSRTQLYAWSGKMLSEADCRAIDVLIARRCNGEPVAYIVGYKEFWSLNFKVTRDTLIPRPETEHLVELALTQIPKKGAWQIADLGSGSGAIAIAIAKERPACQLLAVDKSAPALKIASENAAVLSVKNIRFCQSNWFESLHGESFDLIVSNPPYISLQDKHLSQGDVIYEPKSALVSGADGLDDIRQIIKQAKKHLQPGAALLLEHGWSQATDVRAIFSAASYSNIYSHKDLAEHERVSQGVWAASV